MSVDRYETQAGDAFSMPLRVFLVLCQPLRPAFHAEPGIFHAEPAFFQAEPGIFQVVRLEALSILKQMTTN